MSESEEWAVVLEEPAAGNYQPNYEQLFSGSLSEAQEHARKVAYEFEPLNPAILVGRQVYQMSGGSWLVVVTGMSSKSSYKVHLLRNMT